jgi:hypothetical protein
MCGGEVGTEDKVEVSDAGVREGCDRAAVGGANNGRAWKGGMGEMVNFPLGSMLRSGMMGSWLKVMRECVHGVGLGVGRMEEVAGVKCCQMR